MNFILMKFRYVNPFIIEKIQKYLKCPALDIKTIAASAKTCTEQCGRKCILPPPPSPASPPPPQAVCPPPPPDLNQVANTMLLLCRSGSRKAGPQLFPYRRRMKGVNRFFFPRALHECLQCSLQGVRAAECTAWCEYGAEGGREGWKGIVCKWRMQSRVARCFQLKSAKLCFKKGKILVLLYKLL